MEMRTESLQARAGIEKVASFKLYQHSPGVTLAAALIFTRQLSFTGCLFHEGHLPMPAGANAYIFVPSYSLFHHYLTEHNKSSARNMPIESVP